ASVLGIDGHYVDQRRLMIEAHEFRVADLGRPLNLGRHFDLVQSLEAAEHLPSDVADNFVKMLTAHGPLGMFSAAVPGQGGEHHINEQPLEYWREKFHRCRYVAIDYIRPQVIGNQEIQRWYRNNIVLYAHEACFQELPDCLRAFRVPEGNRLHEYWRLPDRIRHALIRGLPRGVVDHLSRFKAHVEIRRSRSADDSSNSTTGF